MSSDSGGSSENSDEARAADKKVFCPAERAARGDRHSKAVIGAAAAAADVDLAAVQWRTTFEFHVNGKRVVADDVQPHQTLLSFLRDRLGLTGTKLGCGEGGCGACTVTVSHFDHDRQEVVHRGVNACLAPICSVEGCSVTTVEGIGTARKPHEVQKRIAEMHGSQCGFCTPGIVMALYSKLCTTPEPAIADIESAFDGNLCRCTGYRPILDAARTFACDKHAAPSPEEKPACEGGAKPECEGGVQVCSSTSAAVASFPSCGGKSLAVPFPEALRKAPAVDLKVAGEQVTWYRPTSLSVLLALKKQDPTAKLVSGNTEIGIETKFKKLEYPVMISTISVKELHELSFDDEGALVIGGAVTLSSVEHFIEKALEGRQGMGYSWLKAMLDMLRWFASAQIRNVAVLAGNIATASPISDMNPVLMALGATVTLAGCGGQPREVLVRDFFKRYRTVDMEPSEVICRVRVPPTSGEFEFVRSFKQARRRDDDISIVNACVRLELRPGEKGWIVDSVDTGFGGMAPTTKRARRAEEALTGAEWSADAIEKACSALAEDLPLPERVPGGMAAYRQTLAASFLKKFWLGVSQELATRVADAEPGRSLPPLPAISAEEASGGRSFLSEDRPVTSGAQLFSVPSGGMQHSSATGGQEHDPDDCDKRAPVGQPMQHRSALAQCTGEAKYVDDMPLNKETLHAAFVLSERAHAKLVSVDASAALACEGVAGFFSAEDIDEHDNLWGPILPDEQLFRRSEVTSTGQLIGVVVAETQEQADAARRLVKVEYEDLEPVLTIQDAIKAKSFHQWVRRIDDGDVDAAFALPDTVEVSGEFRMGGQEHFYLETNCCHVVPGEGDELTIYASTQAAMKTQKCAAHACGIHASKVVCKVKRMGGGFGGKETRTVFISSAVAFAAHRLGRPVRINIERDQDMWITGTRHPFYAKYRVAAAPDGTLRALDLQLYCNAGYSLDLTEPVLGRALFHCENVYKIPNVRAVGYICITNTTSNTAFRGFGGPQGLLVAEAYLEHMANKLKIDPEEMRARNLYAAEGDRTHFGQLLEACPVRRMYSELSESASLARRAAEIATFNEANRWRKRGIALLPTKFGISFTAKFMNQAGALVHIYVDGTVLVTHGGTEMGQGLHTKICQVAARALGVPVEDVYIRETATDTVPNSSPTAASASSDIYGMAVLNACEQLSGRLAPYLEKCGGDFKKAVTAGFFDRCDLSAHGFYATPDIGYDWNNPNCKERGTPFRYFTYGAACSEVEIDCLTGDMRVLRADILMDLGNSLNPAIDVGQIEGAYVQGVGWSMLEEVVWGCDEFPWLKPGALHTRGPGTYKIPSFNDVPVDMRVTLFKDSANPKAIHSSRAVGEPPFFLGTSAFMAARKAIASARRDNGHPDEHFVSDLPLTPERIRMACADQIGEGFSTRPRPSVFC